MKDMMKEWKREDRKGLKLTYPMDLDPSIFEYHKSTCDVNAHDATTLRQQLNGMFGYQVKLVNAHTGRKFIGHLHRDRIRTDGPVNPSPGNASHYRTKSASPTKLVNTRWKSGLIVTQNGTTKCRRFTFDDITYTKWNRMNDGSYRMEIGYNE